MEAMLKGCLFTNGQQLSLLIPSGVGPNPLRRKHACRLWDLQTGAFLSDVFVENVNYGASACFDTRNELLWMNTPDSWLVSRWAHQGECFFAVLLSMKRSRRACMAGLSLGSVRPELSAERFLQQRPGIGASLTYENLGLLLLSRTPAVCVLKQLTPPQILICARVR
jgi:hypothetical protein